MHLARPNRLGRVVTLAALAALLGAVALLLSQCTMVGESLTGVGLEKTARANCVNACNQDYQIAIAAAKKDCGDDAACFNAAHAAALLHKQECFDTCHKQGAGNGG